MRLYFLQLRRRDASIGHGHGNVVCRSYVMFHGPSTPEVIVGAGEYRTMTSEERLNVLQFLVSALKCDQVNGQLERFRCCRHNRFTTNDDLIGVDDNIRILRRQHLRWLYDADAGSWLHPEVLFRRINHTGEIHRTLNHCAGH